MMKKRSAERTLSIFALAALLLLIARPSVSSAQTLGQAVCSSIFTSQGYSVFNYISSLNGMLGVSLLIILIMLMVTGITYGIGMAFKIDKLTRFSKTEIGEIIVTVLVVLIFLGTFSLSSSISPSSPPTNQVTGSSLFSSAPFYSACGTLADSSLSLLPAALGLALNGMLYQFASSLTISLEPNHFGVAFSPFAGLSMQVSILSLVYNLTWMFMMLLMGLAVFLFIVYSLFPIFLFTGVVLRTLPWTRAAGGAFLGFFIGFFVLLPLLLNFMLTLPSGTSTSTCTTTNSVTLCINPDPAVYGQAVTVTATCPSVSDTCYIDYPSPGTHIAVNSETGGRFPQPTNVATYTYAADSLAVGSYSSFYANDITTHTLTAPETLTMLSSGLQGGLSSALGSITSISSTLLTPSTSGNMLVATPTITELIDILNSVLFSVVGAIIAIIITIDFSETMGDFLGAPSLATSNTLKKLI